METIIPKYIIVNALKRNKSFVNQLIILEQIFKNTVHSINALRFNVILRGVIHINTTNNIEARTIKIEATETIIPAFGHFDKNNIYDVIGNIISKYIGNIDVCGKIKSVDLEDVYIQLPKHNTLMWTETTVSVYYIEQECGEHWIELPIEFIPKIQGFTNFYN